MAVPVNPQSIADDLNRLAPDWLRGLLGYGQTNVQFTPQTVPNTSQRAFGRFTGGTPMQTAVGVAPTTTQDVIDQTVTSLAPPVAGVFELPGYLRGSTLQGATLYTKEDVIPAIQQTLGDDLATKVQPWIDAALARRPNFPSFLNIDYLPNNNRNAVFGVGDIPQTMAKAFPEVPEAQRMASTAGYIADRNGTFGYAIPREHVATPGKVYATEIAAAAQPEDHVQTLLHEVIHSADPRMGGEEPANTATDMIRSQFNQYGLPPTMARNALDSPREILAELISRRMTGLPTTPANYPTTQVAQSEWEMLLDRLQSILPSLGGA